MDIELAIDMLEMAPHIDHAVLFSGDGDFRRVVEAVQRKGVRVTVVSTFRANPPMVADELRRQADTFVELQDITKFIARESRRDGGIDEMPDFVKKPVSRGPTPADPDPEFNDGDDQYEDA